MRSLDEKLRLLAAELVRISCRPEAYSAVQPRISSTLPDMSTGSSLGPESFQKLLANAFAVQESQMETQSLSAIVQVQRLIKSGGLDLEAAMRLIADRTRSVANATGVAIGLLKGDQLVYRAGSGSAASYVGRRVMAALSVSATDKTSREVLRVENAQTDARIEAAICRQFGAESLLILLIYHDRALAGVLQVFFSDAHRFQDSEVRTYRLMAGLVGEAMFHAAQPARQEAPAAELSTVPQAIHQLASVKFLTDTTFVPEPPNEHATRLAWGAIMARAGGWRGWYPTAAMTATKQRLKFVLNEPWSYAAVAGAVAMLVIAGWISKADRRPVPASGASTLQKSNAVELGPVLAAKPVGDVTPALTPKATFHRVRAGRAEVDYVSDDVTVRYFTTSPKPQPVLAGYKQVDIGKDVTVRYFAPKTAVVPPTPGSATTGRHKTRL